jgi:CspA family cold shock protein
MKKGRVKFFDQKKGWGFIEKDEGGDVFVHHSGIVGGRARSLEEGQTVEFEEEVAPKGTQAKNVKPLKDPDGNR